MIVSVEKLRTFLQSNETDAVLGARLQALELLIRKYTNNNFQNRNIRFYADIAEGLVIGPTDHLAEGDTVQISESAYNDGIYTVNEIGDVENVFQVREHLTDEDHVLVTQVSYPIDVQMGVVNLMKWELENRDKVGIQSETISRHAVTYFNMDGDNSTIGYPKSLIGFLRPYMKARF